MNDEEIAEFMGFEACAFTPGDDACEQCCSKMKQLYFSGPADAGCYLCINCIKTAHFQHVKDLKRISQLEAAGHGSHCAARQVYGDGECECEAYKKGYDPYAWKRAVDELL